MLEEQTSGEDGAARLRKYNLGGSGKGSGTPQHAYYAIGKLLRLVFVYAAFKFLEASGAPIIPFIFWCLVGSAVLFLGIQQPWKGRPLPSTQVVPTLVNGGVLAFSLLLWAHALRTAGPIRTIVAEYSGVAVTGVSTLLLSRRGNRTRKIRGLACMLAALFMFSRGWSTASSSALISLQSLFVQKATSNQGSGSADAGHVLMLVPVAAGLMSALRRLLARRTSLKTQSKKRLHSITVAAAAIFMFPPYMLHLVSGESSKSNVQYQGSRAGVVLGTIVFGIVLNFYVDTFGEDRLFISTTSRRHVAATLGSVAALELIYGMDFSILGFLLCASVLGLGVHWCSSVDIPRKDLVHLGLLGGDDKRRLSDLPTSLKGPLEHVMADQKSRRIACFLLINTAFMLVEFIYGFLSNSLGLISDAVHMLFDCAALIVGLYASYIARLPATPNYPYGYGRFEVLAGYINAVFLVFVATLIVLESLERLLEPPDIATDKLMLVSVGGFLVNVIGLLFFHDAHMHAHGGSCSHSHSHKPEEHAHKGEDLHADACSHDHKHHGHSHSHDDHRHGGHHEHDHHHHHSGGDCHHHAAENGHEKHGHSHANGQVQHHHHGDGYRHEQHGDGHGHDHHNHGDGHGHDHHNHVDGHGHNHHNHGGGQDGHHGHSHMDHNMRGIFLHVLADTLGSVGVIISTFLIQYKGWVLADPACSIFISGLIILSVIPLLQNAAEILLQRQPRDAERDIKQGLEAVGRLEGVAGCGRPHFWSFTPKALVGSLHVRVTGQVDRPAVRRRVVEIFKSRGLSSMTVQLEGDSIQEPRAARSRPGPHDDVVQIPLS